MVLPYHLQTEEMVWAREFGNLSGTSSLLSPWVDSESFKGGSLSATVFFTTPVTSVATSQRLLSCYQFLSPAVAKPVLQAVHRHIPYSCLGFMDSLLIHVFHFS